MTAKILIDGDIICYQITDKIEEAIHWGNDMWTLHSDFNQAKSEFESYLKNLKSNLKMSEVIIFLTDGNNFRKTIYPDYKGNRINKRKPTCLHVLKDWLRQEHNAIIEPRLEADDLLGIYATNPDYKGSIVVSLDKDLKTVPGKLSADGVHTITISEDEAYYNHAIQILTGDTTDNYPGCPGIGPKTAAKILDNIKPKDYWKVIVNTYIKATLTENDALTQARISYILHWKDYDFKTKKIKGWRPRTTA